MMMRASWASSAPCPFAENLLPTSLIQRVRGHNDGPLSVIGVFHDAGTFVCKSRLGRVQARS